MKRILVLGAGRSSSSLINYLISNANKFQWKLTVADASIELAQQKVHGSSVAVATSFDVHDSGQRENLVSNHDLVISLMPPPFHMLVAETCLKFKKHLLTASYVSPEIASLDEKAKQQKVLILMETGLDPGIDHMSAMVELNKISKAGGILTSFKSYTGGLIAPESDDNPWNYKITWNPRNVVLAGKGTSTFLKDGKVEEVNYSHLFKTTELLAVKGFGDFEGYPNRDSLKYLETYDLKGLTTFLRGTLRRPGYCTAWNILVQMGYTNDVDRIVKPDLTYKELTERLLSSFIGKSIKEKLKSLGSEDDVQKVLWLGIDDNEKINIQNGTPADALQKLMEEKWKLKKGDKDMIVMQHQFEYELNGEKKKLNSSLVVLGENEVETAMAKTVGLPLGIAAKLVLENKFALKGVQIPVIEQLYIPILKELEGLGIKFVNEEVFIKD
jgi:saccharopine dehydrogenase-like NADP-dependent oxidoreductase